MSFHRDGSGVQAHRHANSNSRYSRGKGRSNSRSSSRSHSKFSSDYGKPCGKRHEHTVYNSRQKLYTRPKEQTIKCFNCQQKLPTNLYNKKFIAKWQRMSPHQQKKTEAWCLECTQMDYYAEDYYESEDDEEEEEHEAQYEETPRICTICCTFCKKNLNYTCFDSDLPYFLEELEKTQRKRAIKICKNCISCIERGQKSKNTGGLNKKEVLKKETPAKPSSKAPNPSDSAAMLTLTQTVQSLLQVSQQEKEELKKEKADILQQSEIEKTALKESLEKLKAELEDCRREKDIFENELRKSKRNLRRAQERYNDLHNSREPSYPAYPNRSASFRSMSRAQHDL